MTVRTCEGFGGPHRGAAENAENTKRKTIPRRDERSDVQKRTLTDFKSDRRMSAGFNTGQLTGNATTYLQVVQGVWQTLRIVDTNPAATCSCAP